MNKTQRNFVSQLPGYFEFVSTQIQLLSHTHSSFNVSQNLLEQIINSKYETERQMLKNVHTGIFKLHLNWKYVIFIM